MKTENISGVRMIIAGVVLLLAVLLFFQLIPFTTIGAGERGVVMTWGKVSDRIMGEGLNFKVPFIQEVKKVSVRVQKTERLTSSASSTGQDVKALVVMNWQLKSNKVNKTYQEIGEVKAVEDIVIIPAIDGVVRAETSKFKAQDVLDKRGELEQNVVNVLKKRISGNYEIVIRDIYLTNVTFSDKVNLAIEDKAAAEQQRLQSIILADKAYQDGLAKINIASAEAQAQRLQQETLTPLLIQKQLVEALESGKIKLPDTVVLGNGQNLSDFILNLAQ